MIKEEAGGYIADKVVLKNLVRFRDRLIPRFFFYFFFFTLGAAVELTIFLPQVITREYLVAVVFTIAAAIAFGVETLQQRRGI